MSWFDFRCWLTLQRVYITCWFWDLRGLSTCKEHGFHAQSWINGDCKECEMFEILKKYPKYWRKE